MDIKVNASSFFTCVCQLSQMNGRLKTKRYPTVKVF